MIFDDMRRKGLISFRGFNRNYRITSRKKSSRRKHYYVTDDVYNNYYNQK